MQLNSNDIRINHYHLGRGKGCEVEAIYLPTGESVVESIAADSTETERTLQARLLSALRAKIQEEGQAREDKSNGRMGRRKAP